jgi:uncharacterized protein (TIGR03083 family)
MSLIEPAHGLAHLERAAADIADMLAVTELHLPVPSCPGWAVADLVAHLGQTHLWAEHCIRVRDPNLQESDAPATERAALAAWYAECAKVLIETLRVTDPASECWTFGQAPRTAAFWFRRQAHEAAMHRWDLGAALGRDVGYPSSLAADGIDEVLSMFFPRQVRLGRIRPLERSLAVRTDGIGRWVLAGVGTVAEVGLAEAEVSGPAEVVVLLLWGRIAMDDPRLQLTGDRAAAAAVLSAGIVP